jgi:hypothetical protein
MCEHKNHKRIIISKMWCVICMKVTNHEVSCTEDKFTCDKCGYVKS